MTHAEWKQLCASDPAKANAICAERMGWERNRPESQMGWHSKKTGYGTAEWDWFPITSRDDAAMMVEKVAKNGDAVSRFIDTLGTETGGRRVNPLNGTVSVSWQPVDVLLAPPPLISYCACVALDKEQP